MKRYHQWEIAGILTFLVGFFISGGAILWIFTAYAAYRGNQLRKEQLSEQEFHRQNIELKKIIALMAGILVLLVLLVVGLSFL